MSAARSTAAGRWTAAFLLLAACGPGSAQSGAGSPTKKELAAKAVQLQLPGIEAMARGLVEQPAVQMLSDAGLVLQQRVPADQREPIGRRIQELARKYVDEATPLVRDRAVRMAPAAFGAALEERFTEDELKQLVAWLESPVSRKYQQAVPEMQTAFVQKLVADARPSIDPKLQALEQSIRSALGLPAGDRPAAPRPGTAPAPAPSTSKPAGR